MLQRWSVKLRETSHLTEVARGRRENGHVTEVVTNGGIMVILQRWTVQWRENAYVTEVVSLMEGERSC